MIKDYVKGELFKVTSSTNTGPPMQLFCYAPAYVLKTSRLEKLLNEKIFRACWFFVRNLTLDSAGFLLRKKMANGRWTM